MLYVTIINNLYIHINLFVKQCFAQKMSEKIVKDSFCHTNIHNVTLSNPQVLIDQEMTITMHSML